jgi:hypothetical protein
MTTSHFKTFCNFCYFLWTFKNLREMPCISGFQRISGWGRWGNIYKFLYNIKVAIFYLLYDFHIYIPPSPPDM